MTEKKSTRKTKLTAKQREKRAIEILQQALASAISEGVEIKSKNHNGAFVVVIIGYNEQDGEIKKCVN
jgi:DNA integrity scanning protein DisA with diadenylate cyclase activity